MINMREARDCGLVAMSNYVGDVLEKYDTEAAYNMIRRENHYPGGDGLRCDFWDSPSRHFDIIEKMTGKRPRLVKDQSRQACVILIKRAWNQWHWITRFDPIRWHDGYRVRFGPIPHTVNIVLAYAVDGDEGDLPWYWRLWGVLTGWC